MYLRTALLQTPVESGLGSRAGPEAATGGAMTTDQVGRLRVQHSTAAVILRALHYYSGRQIHQPGVQRQSNYHDGNYQDRAPVVPSVTYLVAGSVGECVVCSGCLSSTTLLDRCDWPNGCWL